MPCAPRTRRSGGAYYLQSAECYRRAAALQPATYPLINAATLSLLSGNRAQAEEIAREVLERIAREPDEPETPYWRAATEAEALLLLGRREEARAALAAAVAAAPRAWEDHASTLRQFLAIQDALGGDRAWLALLRPPRSLSYAAAKADGADPDEAMAAPLDARHRLRLRGAGGGARAASSPRRCSRAAPSCTSSCPAMPRASRRASSTRTGRRGGGASTPLWPRPRACATSARCIAPPDAALVALADRIARGAALLNAERLMGEAAQSRPPDAGAARPAGLALLAIRVGAGGEAASRIGSARSRDALAGGGQPDARAAPQRRDDPARLCRLRGARPRRRARVHARLRGGVPLQHRRPLRADRLRARPVSRARCGRPAAAPTSPRRSPTPSRPARSASRDDFAAMLAAGGGAGRGQLDRRAPARSTAARRSAFTRSLRRRRLIAPAPRAGAARPPPVRRRRGG